MADDTQKAIYARVSGRVQGVGFRFSTARQAKKLSLRGYVRNLPDGSVETIAEGDAENVQSLIRWLKKGPPGAYIQDIEHRTISYRGTYRSFSIEY